MLNEPIVVPSSYPHPHPRGRSATFPKRLKQPSNSLCTAHGRRSPGPLTRGRGGSTFGQMVERTFAWLHNFRRLRIRYERSPELHLAFMLLGCAVICQRMLAWP